MNVDVSRHVYGAYTLVF